MPIGNEFVAAKEKDYDEWNFTGAVCTRKTFGGLKYKVYKRLIK